MNTLVRISASPREGWTTISVDAAEAEMLRSYLRSLLLAVSPIRDTALKERAQGRTDTPRSEFDVQATPKSVDHVVGAWIKKRFR
jgi:hypothetical protein